MYLDIDTDYKRFLQEIKEGDQFRFNDICRKSLNNCVELISDNNRCDNKMVWSLFYYVCFYVFLPCFSHFIIR